MGPAQGHCLDAVGKQMVAPVGELSLSALDPVLEQKNLGHPHCQAFNDAKVRKLQGTMSFTEVLSTTAMNRL